MLIISSAFPLAVMMHGLLSFPLQHVEPLPFISSDELQAANVDGISLRFASNSGQTCNFAFTSAERILSIHIDGCLRSRTYINLDKGASDIQLNSVKISQPYGTEIFYRIRINYGEASDCYIGNEGKNYIEIGVDRTGDITASKVELVDCLYQTESIEVHSQPVGYDQ